MLRSFLGTSLFLLLAISHSFCCWCVPGSPSTHVKAASIVFVGKAVFNDDDGSRKFTQKTLVRFEVEEAYKGLGNVHEVWLDPGSFTSCYQTFHVGDRYLVFANDRGNSPPDTLSITVVPDNGKSKHKPVPPGFDLKNPPKVYWAPECVGTHWIVPETEKETGEEIDYLRKYKQRAAENPSDQAKP
jgi:hypothetical protein